MSKLFSAGVIRKASRYHKVFKESKHRDKLALEAGRGGLSNLQMDKKLKEMGYDPKRRKAVASHLLGGKGSRVSMEEISALTENDISKLPWLERERIGKIKKVKKQRNINLGRYERYKAEQEEAQKKGAVSGQTHLGVAGQSGEVGGSKAPPGIGINRSSGPVFASSLNKK